MNILHLFHYKIEDIDLEKIKEQGFDGIQIGPVQPLKEEGDIPWFLLYQPIAFEVGNYYYNYNELLQLFKDAKKLDIKVIIDVVLNHVAGKNNGEIIPHEKVDCKIRENMYFLKEKNKIEDWNNRCEIINKSIGLPCLRLDNYELQDIIIEFLNELIDMGASGFRIDAGKHIALPIEASDFFIRVFEKLKRKDLFNYIEVIFVDETLINEYSKYGYVLTENNEMENNKIVHFIESHDSYLEFGYTKDLTDNEILEGYRNLKSKFEHTLFYARPFNNLWKSEEVEKIHSSMKLNLS